VCGIFGLVLNSQNGGVWKDADAIENMMYFDALRGMDSTGIGLIDNEFGMRLIKEASDANTFLKTKEWTSVRQEFIASGKALIGHNRKKTSGSIKDETAHPFLIDNRYLFIHNGTLYNHKHLANTEVDSEALGIHITKCKTKEELEEALYNVYGAYACAWIDQKAETLHLLRNKDRSLWYGKYDAGWAFCSEPGFMKLAFARQGLKMEEVQEVPVDALISFDLSKHNPVPITEALTIKKYQTTTVTTQSKSGGQTNDGAGVSKNQFKRLNRGGFIGKSIEFKPEDYIEKEPGNPHCTDWHLFSKCSDLTFNHVIHHSINAVSKNDLDDFYMDLSYTGEIESMLYDPKQRVVNIHMKKVDINWKTLPQYPLANNAGALH
jgi:predicted glutamine amidotransferase